jgi:hypothetical protein
LALAGLSIALVQSDLAAWPIVLAWLLVLAAFRLTRPLRAVRRELRILLALLSMPLLVALISLMGPYLLPAASAWLLVELFAQRTFLRGHRA